jgi:hypothetical protein
MNDTIFLDGDFNDGYEARIQRAKRKHELKKVEEIFGTFERNWNDDYSFENGQYCNKCMTCGLSFVGHKRRVVCVQCAEKEGYQRIL